MSDRLYIECQCTDPYHVVIFDKTYYDDEYELSLFVGLNKFQPWYRRIVIGFKYMFGFSYENFEYSEVLVDDENREKIMKFQVVYVWFIGRKERGIGLGIRSALADIAFISGMRSPPLL